MDSKNSGDTKKLLIWLNGKKVDNSFEVEISSSINSIRRLKETVIYKMNTHKINLDRVRLFNYYGIEIDDSDINYLTNNQTIYLSIDGSDFSVLNHVNEYEFVKWIKTGGYGKVYQARHAITGDVVAIKMIDVHDFSSEELYNISRESVYLGSLKHKNIIKFFNSFVHDNIFYNVMEYAQGGELTTYLAKGPLPEAEAKNIFRQVHDAVKHIHSRNVIHRDLKPNNILFLDNEHTQVVLIDFGISGFCNGYSKETVKAGTIRFAPPELASGEVYTSSPKLDIWALGVLLYLMCFGLYPFEAVKEAEIANKIISQPLKFPKNIIVSKTCYTLIQGMLEKNPCFRIDICNQLFEDWYNEVSETNIKAPVSPRLSGLSISPGKDRKISNFSSNILSLSSLNSNLPENNLNAIKEKNFQLSKSPDTKVTHKTQFYLKPTISSTNSRLRASSIGINEKIISKDAKSSNTVLKSNNKVSNVRYKRVYTTKK